MGRHVQVRQQFLEERKKGHPSSDNDVMDVINWNISNPSKKRAIGQMQWLLKKEPDIIALTETKNSQGCMYIRDKLYSCGYDVIFPLPKGDNYGVLLAIKHEKTPSNLSIESSIFPARLAASNFVYEKRDVEILVIYVPNARNEIKKSFLSGIRNTLQSSSNKKNRIFCGDFNVLEPSHIPFYRKFEDWEYDFYNSLKKYDLFDGFRHLHPKRQEYSWVGRTGDGYRYDHFFVSKTLLVSIDECFYIHEPRKIRLSDHSAMYLKLKYVDT